MRVGARGRWGFEGQTRVQTGRGRTPVGDRGPPRRRRTVAGGCCLGSGRQGAGAPGPEGEAGHTPTASRERRVPWAAVTAAGQSSCRVGPGLSSLRGRLACRRWWPLPDPLAMPLFIMRETMEMSAVSLCMCEPVCVCTRVREGGGRSPPLAWSHRGPWFRGFGDPSTGASGKSSQGQGTRARLELWGPHSPSKVARGPVARGGAVELTVSFHPGATGRQLRPTQKWLLTSAPSPGSSGHRMPIEGHGLSSLAAAPPASLLGPILGPPSQLSRRRRRERTAWTRLRPGQAGGGAAPVLAWSGAAAGERAGRPPP